MRKKSVHLVGIGGIGVSGIAKLLLEAGWEVSGSDVQSSAITTDLERDGVRVFIGHKASHVEGADLVIFSSSIAPSNPELIAARNRKIPTWPRGRALAASVAKKRTIAVAGSHGKTTTTAFVSSVLLAGKQDPTILIGAEVPRFGGNARVGKGRWAVVETDESDGSFLYMHPSVAVITNIDQEHLDFYRNLDETYRAYAQFAKQLKPKGALLGCVDDPGVRALIKRLKAPWLTYGCRPSAQLRATRIQSGQGHSRYTLVVKGKSLGPIELPVAGHHNVLNSLAAVGCGLFLGISFSKIQSGLAEVPQIARRFESRGMIQKVQVIEDYAHHPAEIDATLKAARSWEPGRLLCVFQPHRFSRTQHLKERFGSCFSQADQLILTDVYAASEDPGAGTGVDALYRAVRKNGFKPVQKLRKDKIVSQLTRTTRAGDMVLVLGAGDIGDIAGELVTALERKQN